LEIEMANDSKEKASMDGGRKTPVVDGPLRVGLIATASALAGGLAVAWWYRDTLKKLRNPVISENIPKYGYSEGELSDADKDPFDASEPGTLPRLVQD